MWIGLGVVSLGCVLFYPVFTAIWRNVRSILHFNTPEFRLSVPNFWTGVQHIKNGGSRQIMKMEDGNFIFLSLGLDTAKVFFTPRLDSIESFTELASFPIFRDQK